MRIKLTDAERKKIAVHIKLHGYPTLEEVERGYPRPEDYDYEPGYTLCRLERVWLSAWIRLLWSPGMRDEDLETRKTQTAVLERVVERFDETQGDEQRERQALGVRPFKKGG